jgi:hypothetical protein
MPFSAGSTVSLAATTATSNVALAPNAGNGNSVRISSPTANSLAFVKFGGAGVTAALTDIPILPGTTQTLTIPQGATFVAAITAATTATLYFTSGTES